MTDRPILFSAPMVRALLDGRKTQTRRLAWSWREVPHGDGEGLIQVPTLWQKVQPGDRLWVKETVACAAAASRKPSQWAPSFWRREQGTPANPNGLWYAADGLAPENPIGPRGVWVAGRYLPRWTSRLTLTVTEVRVQRLQDISDADARAEGIHEFRLATGSVFGYDPKGTPGHLVRDRAVDAFEALWISLHGPGSWDENPEVVALTFTVWQRNIDA